MNLKLPQLLALAIGGTLIYAAVKDVNAVEVIKAVLTGQPLPVGGNGLPAKTPVTDEEGNPDGYFNDKGEYIPRTDANTPQPQGTPDGSPGGAVPMLYNNPGNNYVTPFV